MEMSMPSFLQHPYSIPVRPLTGKEMEIVDLNQLFEEYVDTNLLQHSDDSALGRLHSDEAAHLFSISLLNETGSFSTSLRPNGDTEAAWQHALQRCEQNPASFTKPSVLHFGNRDKEVFCDSRSVGFVNQSEQESNQSQSISLLPISRPPSVISTEKATLSIGKSSSCGVQEALSKLAPSSLRKIMQHSYNQCSMLEAWAHTIETPSDYFVLQTSPDTTQSPPSFPVAGVPNKFLTQDSQLGVHGRSTSMDYNPTLSGVSFPGYRVTSQTSPTMMASGTKENTDSYSSNLGLSFRPSASKEAHPALQTPPSSLQVRTTFGALNTPVIADFSYSASPEYSITESTGQRDNGIIQYTNQSTNYNNASMTRLGTTCSTTNSCGFRIEEVVGNETKNSNFNLGYTSIYPMLPQNHSPIPHTPHRVSRSCSPRRRRTSSRSHRTRSSSCQTSGSVDFVNFTPDDSLKILTGVAPSGSSKTKARREKEAAEKRRKLSQAAMKAIIEAGGDVDSLMRLDQEELFGIGG